VTDLKEELMRRLALAAVALTVLALAAAPSAMAHGSPFAKRPSGELLGQWWKTVLEVPVSKNPLTGNADPCILLGRRVLAPAFAAGGEIACSVEPGTSIVAITFTSECSDAEDPPFYGKTPRARAVCARATADGVTNNEVGIDGVVYDVSRYRATSPDLRVRLPEDDLFGVDARSLRFTADGWPPLIEPLRRGHHVISVRSAGSDPGRPSFDDFGTLQLDVGGRHGHGHGH
jgi:hypothetical protein